MEVRLEDQLKSARLRLSAASMVQFEKPKAALLTETLTEVFSRLLSPSETAEKWNEGVAALSVSVAWMEHALLDLYGEDIDATPMIANTFSGIRRRFEQLYDAATNWPGEEE